MIDKRSPRSLHQAIITEQIIDDFTSKNQITSRKNISSPETVPPFTQLNDYSFVGIQREYNQLLTIGTFCIGLLVMTFFAHILGHLLILPSPGETCHPRKRSISAQNPKCEKCFEFRLFRKTSTGTEGLQTNPGRLGNLPKKILGVSTVQIFHNRVSSSWHFRENPTDDTSYYLAHIPPSIRRLNIDRRFWSKNQITNGKTIFWPKWRAKLMQLQEYSCVGILRQYNKYFTGETFCVELLLTTSFHPYCGSSMPPSLSSPDMSSKEEPDFNAKSRFRKVLRVRTRL